MNASLPQRRITLIRHAKAEDDGVTPDHARHLNARGRTDAQALGSWLRAGKHLPELLVCSTAARTRETLQHVLLAGEDVAHEPAGAMRLNVPTILTERAYLASAAELIALLQETDDAVMHVGLIGHNPGLHQLAAMLAGSVAHRDDGERLMLKFPTSACALLTFQGAHWRDLASQAATLEQFHLVTM